MKNYLLFSGERYYPYGGMEDFKCDYNTINEAMDAFQDTKPNIDEWCNILSIIDGKVIVKYYYGRWHSGETDVFNL